MHSRCKNYFAPPWPQYLVEETSGRGGFSGLTALEGSNHHIVESQFGAAKFVSKAKKQQLENASVAGFIFPLFYYEPPAMRSSTHS